MNIVGCKHCNCGRLDREYHTVVVSVSKPSRVQIKNLYLFNVGPKKSLMNVKTNAGSESKAVIEKNRQEICMFTSFLGPFIYIMV